MPQTIEDRRAKSLRWYYANREHQLRGDRARHATHRTAARNYVDEFLSTHPCVDCGETDPVVLDFDHVAGKSFNIARGISALMPLERIRDEVAKCEIRCANCHRRKTHRTHGHRDKRRLDPKGESAAPIGETPRG